CDTGVAYLLWLDARLVFVEALVRHLDDADVELHAAEAAGLGVTPRQGVEDGGLAGPSEPDDRDLHSAMLPARLSPGAQYPALGSTRLTSGSPAANRRGVSQTNI